MRYFAQITVPIYAETDKEAYLEAEKMRKIVELLHDHTTLDSIVLGGTFEKKGRELNLTNFYF